ncbi:MAG: hypothetical protein K6T30_04300 [Alicyclobacillus sp.]|nr:hypothetical protein [Alicyclobacillus sp.]
MSMAGGTFHPGRYIQFPNVRSWVDADFERAFFQRHLLQDFGSAPNQVRLANQEAIKSGKGEVVSEFDIPEDKKVRFRTSIRFKTVVLIVDADGQVVTECRDETCAAARWT